MTQAISPQAGTDPAGLWRAGSLALRNGDARTALDAFKAIVEAGRAEPAVWLGIALASRNLRDEAAEKDALDRLLEQEPRNVRALMMKADQYARTGDPVAASSYYRAVSRIGAMTPDLPPDLRAEANRADMACAEHTAAYEAHLRALLADKGAGRADMRRIEASLDLIVGKTEIFLQQPTQFYFPELPQIQFYQRDATPWLEAVDAETDAIRGELFAVLKDEHLFNPYVEREADRPFFDRHGMLGDPNWSALFLWKDGAPVEENAARCPRTMQALAKVPLCHIEGRSPSILFSLLRPGARIPPHTGLMNTRLICHLPLIVPEGCGFRVGNETRPWIEGRSFAFDDSIEHEAWNNSDKPRVVLIFDVWRPELTELEREMVVSILKAGEGFGAPN